VGKEPQKPVAVFAQMLTPFTEIHLTADYEILEENATTSCQRRPTPRLSTT